MGLESIKLKFDKEAFDNGYIFLEANSDKDILPEETLEELENEFGVYGQLILNKNYELVFLDHAVLNIKTLEDIKRIPIKGIYSVPELNINNFSFNELIDYLKKIYEDNT